MDKKIKHIIVICCLFFVNLNVFAQYDFWTIGTAKTLPHKMYEIGIFEPFRYGITHRVEVQSFLLAEALAPNVRFKIHWFTTKKWEILVASRHGVYYPTIGMNYIYKNEPFGIEWLDFYPGMNLRYRRLRDLYVHENMPIDLIYAYMHETKIAPTFTFTNELLFSKMLIPRTSCSPPNLLLTLKLGVNKSLFIGKHHIPKIDEPMIYQRSAVLHDSVLWYAGLDLEAHLTQFMDISVDWEYLSVDWDVKDWAIEHKALLVVPLGKFTIAGGYQLSYGSYPEGNRFFAMPLLDLIFRFNVKHLDNGLFKHDPYRRSLKEKNKRKAY